MLWRQKCRKMIQVVREEKRGADRGDRQCREVQIGDRGCRKRIQRLQREETGDAERGERRCR